MRLPPCVGDEDFRMWDPSTVYNANGGNASPFCIYLLSVGLSLSSPSSHPVASKPFDANTPRAPLNANLVTKSHQIRGQAIELK